MAPWSRQVLRCHHVRAPAITCYLLIPLLSMAPASSTTIYLFYSIHNEISPSMFCPQLHSIFNAFPITITCLFLHHYGALFLPCLNWLFLWQACHFVILWKQQASRQKEQGQCISRVESNLMGGRGQTGSASAPCLHFTVSRYRVIKVVVK